MFGSWAWDAQYKSVTMVLNGKPNSPDAIPMFGQYKVYRCPEVLRNGAYVMQCAVPVKLGDPDVGPPEGDGTVYLWSSPATWELARKYNTWTTALPGAGDTVTVPYGMLVRVDMSPPRLFHLEVTG